MARSKSSTRKPVVVAAMATPNSKVADQQVAAWEKLHKGATVTRRRETFSFGVLYVVLAVRSGK